MYAACHVNLLGDSTNDLLNIQCEYKDGGSYARKLLQKKKIRAAEEKDSRVGEAPKGGGGGGH